MKKLLTSLSLGTGVLLASALPVFAQNTGSFCPPGTDKFSLLCPKETSGIGPIFGTIVNLIFVIAIILAFIFLVYGGLRWVVSGGDKTAVESARNTIIAAIVGLVILFLSYVILNIVLGLFGTTLGGEGLTLPQLE